MKLEIGKRYVTRDGRITPPLQESGQRHYKFAAKLDGAYTTWTEGGEYNVGYETCADLVSEYVEPSAEPTPARAPKIIQILLTPNDANWQGRMIGLGDDGVTYHEHDGSWKPLIEALS